MFWGPQPHLIVQPKLLPALRSASQPKSLRRWQSDFKTSISSTAIKICLFNSFCQSNKYLHFFQKNTLYSWGVSSVRYNSTGRGKKLHCYIRNNINNNNIINSETSLKEKTSNFLFRFGFAISRATPPMSSYVLTTTTPTSSSTSSPDSAGLSSLILRGQARPEVRPGVNTAAQFKKVVKTVLPTSWKRAGLELHHPPLFKRAQTNKRTNKQSLFTKINRRNPFNTSCMVFSTTFLRAKDDRRGEK